MPRELLSAGELPADLPADAIFIAISQDCDLIYPSYHDEPWLELLVGLPIGSTDGNFALGKNPRRLHITAALDGVEQHYELNIRHKFRVPRQCIEKGMPSTNILINKKNIRIIASWTGKRYTRGSFPTTFDRRIPAGTRDRIKKLLAKHGQDIRAIYLGLEDVELGPEQPYEVTLRLVVKSEAVEDEAREQALLTVLTDLQQYINDCAGITLADAELKSDREFSLEDALTMKQWDYEYLSAGQEPQEPSVVAL